VDQKKFYWVVVTGYLALLTEWGLKALKPKRYFNFQKSFQKRGLSNDK